MTSGVKMRLDRRPVARRWLAAALLMVASGSSWALAVDELMTVLSQRKSGEARFTEERTVSGLDAPLRASGTLSFTAPDRFARHTLEPRPESMEVQGNTVLLRRGSRSRQMALDTVPELAALADAMRGTLNGDRTTLQRHFRVDVAGNTGKWTMTLTPLDIRLAGQVRLVEIAGENADVRSIDLRLDGGDRSLMRIETVTSAAPRASAP